nr:DUF4010 domain-containing protein [Ferrovibrio sp.]
MGIGLLIGAERERRKGDGPARAAAGIRTFSIAALAGATALTAGGALLLTITTAGTALLAAFAYHRESGGETGDRDPGLTSEIALVLTVLLGGLCMQQPGLAAAIGVTVAVLLAARTPMHVFVRQVLTTEEVRDGLIFAGATLVILPLLPDRAMGPFEAFNPAKIWILVILVMAIGGIGHIAVRALGARYGLPLAGFAGGFVSSTATIGAMGSRATKKPGDRTAAVAAAVLSTIATVLQMALVLAATSLPVLYSLALPLGLAGLAAIGYGAIFTLSALRQDGAHETEPGRAFSLRGALIFAALLTAILFAAAALQHFHGAAGVLAAAALAGFADTHSAAISVAALTQDERLEVAAAAVPILAAFTTNTLSKAVFAWSTGGSGFALRVIPGLLLVAAAAWAGLLIG